MTSIEDETLPPNWLLSPIREVTVRTSQRDPRKQPDKIFRYVDVSSVDNTLFKVRGDTSLKGSEAPSRARKDIRANDVLFATVRPTLKRVALIPSELDGEIASTGYCVLRPNPNKVEPAFLYSCVLTDSFIRAMGKLERGASYPAVRDSDVFAANIPIPPLAEQRKIAAVLGLVQRALEQQERLIALTTELKKTLLHQLFTQGLRGEPQKQTEIGPVPESWEVVELGDVISRSPKNGLYKHNSAYGSGTPILRINDFSNDGDVVVSATHRVATDAGETELYGLREGDIVTNRVNSLSHLGKTALIGRLVEPMVFESNMMRFGLNESRAIPSYVLRLLNSPVCKKQFLGTAKRAVGQASINQGNLRAIKLPLPSVSIQRELVTILDAVIGKI
jgi:type I restriction enzyme, S subunit